MPTRIDKLTPAQEARLDEWADKWIEIGLRTGPADRPKFEAAVRDCYRFAGLEPPKRIVWVHSPIVAAFAGPIADYMIGGAVRGAVSGAVRGAVGGAVDVAVGGAVRGAVSGAVSEAVDEAVSRAVDGGVDEAVRGAVGEAVGGAVSGAVGGVVGGAVREAVRGAVDEAVGGAVDVAVSEAVDEAVGEAVGGAISEAVSEAINDNWARFLGGQFWVGGWWYGGAWTSFFREVCGLELPGDLWDRARAYEATMEAACWWWPHRDFVIVSERPSVISRELVNPSITRGWGSHRLHSEVGPACGFQDGWGIYVWHGIRVPARVIMEHDKLTVAEIIAEKNTEVRRAMRNLYGNERFMIDAGAEEVSRSVKHKCRLLRLHLPGDPVEIKMAELTCPSTGKVYYERVPPDVKDAVEALSWRFNVKSSDYEPNWET